MIGVFQISPINKINRWFLKRKKRGFQWWCRCNHTMSHEVVEGKRKGNGGFDGGRSEIVESRMLVKVCVV